jgi:hypothetical protein
MMENYNLKGLIALVIENDFGIERSIQGLIKDNPDLFAHVHKVTYAMDRQEEVFEILEKEPIDCILLCSTFMYKHQLEEIAYHLADSGKIYKFIIQYAESKLNDWLTEASYLSNFSDRQRFLTLCKTLVKNNLVYEYSEDHKSNITIHDNLHGRYGTWEPDDRKPWKFERIGYSDEHDIFFTDGDDEKEIIRKAKDERNYK